MEPGLSTCVSGKPSSTRQVFYSRLKFYLFEQEKDIEDFITTSLDSRDKSRSPPVGLEGKRDGGGKSESASFSLYFLRLRFPSPQSTQSCCVSTQTAQRWYLPSALCVPLSLCPLCLDLWPGGPSGSLEAPCQGPWPAAPVALLPGAEAAAHRVPSACRSTCSQPDWLRPWDSGWTAAHAPLPGFEFRFTAPARQMEDPAASSPTPGPGTPALRAGFRGGRLLTRRTSAPCPAAPSLSLPSASFISCAPRACALSSWAGFGDGRSLMGWFCF